MFASFKIFFGTKSSPSFRSEFAFTDRIFGFFGLNYETFRLETLKLTEIKSYMGLLVTPIFLVFATTAIVMSFKNLDALIFALIGTLTAFNSLTKVLTVFLNAKTFTRFRHKIIDETSIIDLEPLECEIKERYLFTLGILSKSLVASYFMAAVGLIALPILYYVFDFDNRWQLPLTMKILGINATAHPGYEMHYVFCSYATVHGGILIAACDVTFFYLCFFAMYRLDVCERYCEQFGRNLHDNHRLILKSIKINVDIFRFIQDVSKAFTGFILVQGMLSLLLLTVTIFYSKLHPINSTYIFLVTLLIQLVAYCTCGQLVLNKGENVSKAIYCSDWYKIVDPKLRRSIHMFLSYTQTPNGLSAMNIFEFSFISLTTILKSTASYIAFLQNVMD